AIPQFAYTHHAIDAFADQVDELVPFSDVQLDIRVLREKSRQPRHEEVTRERAVHVDLQGAGRLGAGERGLRFLHLGKNGEAAAVVRLTVESRRDLPGRPLQQPD